MILNQFWADYGRMHRPATVVPLLPRILKHSPNTETKLSEFQIQIEVRCTLIPNIYRFQFAFECLALNQVVGS